jgi:hypothetical protein
MNISIFNLLKIFIIISTIIYNSVYTYKIDKCDLILKAKLCKICYSKTNKLNISRNKMTRIYDNYIFINETSTRTISYLFYNKNQIDIFFKGTSNMKDNYFNFDIYPKSYLSPFIKVHHGFLSKYLSLKEVLLRNINDIMNNGTIRKITCNGHSSGGAIASIAIIDIYNELNIMKINDIIIESITFGSPRVGNNEFVKIYNKCVNKSLRVVNWNDIIQYVPPPIPFLYKHIHHPLKLNECKKIYNINLYKYVKTSHGISKYIKNIITCN